MCQDGDTACKLRRGEWAKSPMRATVGQSTLPNAGKGLFAPKDMGYKRGDFITFYSGRYGVRLSGERVMELETGTCIDGSSEECRCATARGDMINDSRRRANSKFVIMHEALALVAVVAARNIFPKAEIFLDYSKPCQL